MSDSDRQPVRGVPLPRPEPPGPGPHAKPSTGPMEEANAVATEAGPAPSRTRPNGHVTRGTPRFTGPGGEALTEEFQWPRDARSVGPRRPNADAEPDPWLPPYGQGDPADGDRFDPAGDHDPQTRDQIGAVEAFIASLMPGRWLAQPAIAAVLMLFASLIGLIALAQVSSFFATVDALPAVGRYLAYAALAAITVAMLSAVGVLTWQYVRLRTSPSVSLRGLRALSARAGLQAAALHEGAEARKALLALLEGYPHDAAHRRHLAALGATEEEIRRLLSARSDLLHRNAGSDIAFIEDMQRRFVATQDVIAERLIWRRARRVAIQTAVVPTGFMDTLIVSVHSYQLVSELARLYHLRAGGAGTALILIHVLISAAVAGQVEELTEHLSDRLFAGAGERLSGVLVGSAAARMGEGAANGLLVRRLGRLTAKRLRPIAAR